MYFLGLYFCPTPLVRGAFIGGMSALCCLSVQNAALAQDSQGTPEQQQACQPDVFRLCGNYIPDADRIVVCLKDNERSLSPACHDVFFPVVEEKPKRKKSPSKR